MVVTFDDGYVDNLQQAKPLLVRYEMPATFFLAAGYLGHEREFWWDELERLLLQPGRLPETLHLDIAGNAYRWALGAAATYSDDQAKRNCAWKAWEEAPSARHQIYRLLWELLHPWRKLSGVEYWIGYAYGLGRSREVVRLTGRFHLRKSVRWSRGN